MSTKAAPLLPLIGATIFLALPFTPCLANSRWDIGATFGLIGPYAYQTNPSPYAAFSEQFNFSWTASLAAHRQLGAHLVLLAEAGYTQYSSQEPLNLAISSSGIASWPRTEREIHAGVPSLGIGARYYASGSPGIKPRFYAQLIPTIYVSNWTEKTHSSAWTDHTGAIIPAEDNKDEFTKLTPGFSLGVGVSAFEQRSFPIDLGLRYLFSAAPGTQDLGKYSSGDFQGLRQFAVVIGVRHSL